MTAAVLSDRRVFRTARRYGRARRVKGGWGRGRIARAARLERGRVVVPLLVLLVLASAAALGYVTIY